MMCELAHTKTPETRENQIHNSDKPAADDSIFLLIPFLRNSSVILMNSFSTKIKSKLKSLFANKHFTGTYSTF